MLRLIRSKLHEKRSFSRFSRIACSFVAIELLAWDVHATPEIGDPLGQVPERQAPEAVTGRVAMGADSSSPPVRTPTRGLAEIVVFARKRNEHSVDVPISISALATRELADRDVRRLQGLSGTVPNLQLSGARGTSHIARIHLRGIGNGDPIATVDPSVGVYVDGVYLARGQGSLLTISDIDRVEVLRGPQGTLFGKNTVGGAIQVFTKQPQFGDVRGDASIRVGNFNRLDTRFSLNVPIAPEQAALRLSLATATQDGFFDNKGIGPDLGDDKTLAGRAQLTLLTGPRSELHLAVDRSRENRRPRGPKCKVTNTIPNSLRVFPVTIGSPNQPGSFLGACAQSDATDNYTVFSNLTFAKEHLDQLGTAATWTWELNDSLEFKSISSWRRQEIEDRFDADATGIGLGEQDSIDAGNEQQDAFSQELQLVGSAFDERLTYVAGLYGFRERNRDRQYFGILPNEDISANFGAPPGTVTGALRKIVLRSLNQSFAGFFQGTYELDRSFALDFGLRRTLERKRVDRAESIDRSGFYVDPCDGTPNQNPSGGTGLVAASPEPLACSTFDRSTRSSDWSPVVRLSYRPNRDMNLYLGWSRGFKSGGFNGRADDPVLFAKIGDEKVSTYELGMKGFFADDRLRVSGAVFHTIHADIQRTITTVSSNGAGLGIIVVNAGEAVINGAELEVEADLFDRLGLRTSIGMLHSRYTRFDSPRDPTAKDNDLTFAPPYTLSFGVSYEVPFPKYGSLRALADWTQVGNMVASTNDARALRQGKRGELSGQVIWNVGDDKTEVVLYGNNLLNREYLLDGLDFSDSFGDTLQYYNDPGTFGVEIRRAF